MNGAGVLGVMQCFDVAINNNYANKQYNAVSNYYSDVAAAVTMFT